MKNYERLKTMADKTHISNERSDYEGYEREILVASLEIEDTGAKLNNDRRSIDDQKDDKWQEIRKDYNSDVGATRFVNKEFREQERPVVIGEEMNKSDEKRLRAFTRRAEVLKSRQIKIMTDEKRQNEVLLSKSI